MRPIGFSTGALAYGDFRRALAMLEGQGTRVLELSALRQGELESIVLALDTLHVEDCFDYASFHAPSSVDPVAERWVVGQLCAVAARGWPIIVHPGAIHTPEVWRLLGDRLCIENMDRRSESGQTCSSLERLFDHFPEAGFCLDLGHARQIDPSMVEAYLMLRRFGSRLRQIHLSEVTETCRHVRISRTAKFAFQSIAASVPAHTPIVLESVLGDSSAIVAEIASAVDALTPPKGGIASAAE